MNVGLRAAYNGLDLFTYKCDNHYVDYLAGHVFMNAIRIGGGSEGGRGLQYEFEYDSVCLCTQWNRNSGCPVFPLFS